MDFDSSIPIRSSNCVDSIRIKFDKFCDFIPFASTLTNVMNLCQRHFCSLPQGEGKDLQDSYWSYINNKESLHCILLAIPVLNIPVAFYYHFFKSENSENSIESENIENPLDSVNQSLVIEQASLSESLHKRLIQEAFGSEKWMAESAGMIGKNEDIDEESASLLDFVNDLGKGLSSEKLAEKLEKMLNDGLFVRVPKDLTYENVGILVYSKLSKGVDGYCWKSFPVNQKPVDDSYWVWFSINEIEDSQDEEVFDQKKMVVEHGYQDCYAREGLAGLVAKYLHSGKIGKNSYNQTCWVRCFAETQGMHHFVVSLKEGGLGVLPTMGRQLQDYVSVSGFLRWRPSEARSLTLG